MISSPQFLFSLPVFIKRLLAGGKIQIDNQVLNVDSQLLLNQYYKILGGKISNSTPEKARRMVDGVVALSYDEEKINNLCELAIRSIDSNPHGNYSIDLKGDAQNNMHVTEIDSGKFHTTTPLWGYISSKFFKQEPKYNLPYLYTKIGLGEISDPEILGNDIYPKETLLVRHIDCGDWIIKDDGTKVQVL